MRRELIPNQKNGTAQHSDDNERHLVMRLCMNKDRHTQLYKIREPIDECETVASIQTNLQRCVE